MSAAAAGFGTWTGLHCVVDSHADAHPETPAAVDASGTWTYRELQRASIQLARLLHSAGLCAGVRPPCWDDCPLAPRPLALDLPRGRLWYALCIAAWRLGLPVVAVSRDMPDKEGERERNARIGRELRPLALVAASTPAPARPEGGLQEPLPELPEDCLRISLESLLEAMDWSGSGASLDVPEDIAALSAVCPESPLLYAYTGGTTKHSKCLVVTHAMALWEMVHYASALSHSISRSDRVLQFTSTFWGAAAFGQIDMALAFGACVVFAVACDVGTIAAATREHRISVLGFVPSQLRGAWPGGPARAPPDLRVVVTWGEKLPARLARQWKDAGVGVYELLIASEYWLALASDCSVWRDPTDGSEKHVLRPVPNLDMLVLTESGKPAGEGQLGELYLSGPTVSPGYLGPDGRVGSGEVNAGAYVQLAGQRYLRTRDTLKRLPGGTFVYYGRADVLAKRGGAWVDLEDLESKATTVPGVAAAAMVAGDGLDAFLVLEPQQQQQRPLLRVLEEVQRVVGNESALHVRSELPLHPATAKVDRRGLASLLSGARAREAEHRSLLRCVQCRVLLAYCSWYLLVLAVLTLPSLAAVSLSLLSPADVPGDLASRVLLLPYFWAAALYGGLPQWERRRAGSISFGVPDVVLLSAALLPRRLLGAAGAAACCVIGAYRGSRCGAFLFAVACLAALAAALRGEELPPCLLLLTCALTGSVLDPSCLGCLPGLPVCCFLAFPKWMSDDWSWRMDRYGTVGALRRWFVKLTAVRPRPAWDASWAWDPSSARVDFTGNVRLNYFCYKPAVYIDFWSEPTPSPALLAPSLAAARPRANGGACAPEAAAAEGRRGALANLLAELAERAGGSPESLGALDSLQAITLAELIRKSSGLDVSVALILRCDTVDELARHLEGEAQKQQGVDGLPAAARGEEDEKSPDGACSFRVFTMHFPRHPVDWCVRYTGSGHLDLRALQRAADRLVARHSALRTRESPDEPLREVMDRAAAVWQLWVSSAGSGSRLWQALTRLVSSALFACWPRTMVRSADQARVLLKVPPGPTVRDEAWSNLSDDEYVFSTIRELNSPQVRWPFEMTVVPMYTGAPADAVAGATAAEIALTLPPESVKWYIYCSITHAYSDGASGQALFGDLIRFYEEELGLVPPDPQAPPVKEHLALLQRRLRRSLDGRLPGAQGDANDDVYHEVACEDWGKREGISRRVYLSPTVARSLRMAASSVLGCSIDVAWLTALSGAVFRLFPTLPCLRFMLKVTCRDGPGQRDMVGFLSEQRVVPLDILNPESATLLGVAGALAAARRRRAWRAPEPFECGLCVYVNIVSAMTDSLPQGFRHVTKALANNASRWTCPAYCHLNVRLDQLSSDEWDFRIFHWDAAWGWTWSDYFAAALGAAIGDMVTSPTAPLLPPSRPQREEWASADAAVSAAEVGDLRSPAAPTAPGGCKRKAEVEEAALPAPAAARAAPSEDALAQRQHLQQSPSKLARLDAAAQGAKGERGANGHANGEIHGGASLFAASANGSAANGSTSNGHGEPSTALGEEEASVDFPGNGFVDVGAAAIVEDAQRKRMTVPRRRRAMYPPEPGEALGTSTAAAA